MYGNQGSPALVLVLAKGSLKLDIGFFYERYRFYGADTIDNLGRSYLVTGETGVAADLQQDQNNS